MRWPTGCPGIGLALGLSACAHAMPLDAPVVERVLGDQALREQLVARGTQDEHFVHEVLHQLGQGPDGDRKLVRLLAEHLHHYRRLSERCFRIGYSKGCVGSWNHGESATRSRREGRERVIVRAVCSFREKR